MVKNIFFLVQGIMKVCSIILENKIFVHYEISGRVIKNKKVKEGNVIPALIAVIFEKNISL
jgi:hypothetical protein